MKYQLMSLFLACACHPSGSISPDCDPVTGQCSCRDKYVGRDCGECQDGFGDVDAGCRRCDCHPEGAASPTCAADDGQCPCKAGVGGLRCTACMPDNFGFSTRGCKGTFTMIVVSFAIASF